MQSIVKKKGGGVQILIFQLILIFKVIEVD